MSYEKALEQWKKVGAGKAEGLPLLAMTCKALSLAHAINPRLAYEGARKLGLDADAVRKLDAIALGNLRRRGMAVAVVLVVMDDTALERAYARLVPEGIRDLRHLSDEANLPDLCRNHVNRLAAYDFASLGE